MKFNVGSLANLIVNKDDQVGRIFRGINPVDRIQKLVITQGYGVREDHLPLRFLSYVVAIMRMVRMIKHHLVEVQVELFIAMEGVLRVSPSYQRNIVTERALQMKQLLERYVEALYPDQRARVKVLLDRCAEPGSELDEYLESLFRHAQGIAVGNERIQKFIAERGGDLALRYASLHPAYLRSPLIGGERFVGALVPGCSQDMDVVIMVGGKAEHVFDAFQEELIASMGLHQQWRPHRVFTPMGSPPTYHGQGWEPAWADLSLPESVVDLFNLAIPPPSLQVLSKTVENCLRDLLTLLLDCAQIPNFRCLPDCLAKAKRQQPFDPAVLEQLQTGWDRLRELF